MMYPYQPNPYQQSYPPAKPPVSGVDLTVSIIVMVVTVLLGAASAFLGLMSVAFLDYCPPVTCSAEGAVGAVMAAVGIAAVVAVAGIVVTIVQLVRRKLAWPFAVGTLAVVGVILALGVVGYGAAVGG